MSDRSRSLPVLAACVLLLLVEVWRFRGPHVAPANAPANRFSAMRAMQYLRATIVDAPHPVGTAAHDAVRDRIVAQLEALGYDTHVQTRFACNAHDVCATTANIIANPPGPSARAAEHIVLAAHYDSVPAGPGMSDDGTGVATILEIARAVRNERFDNRVTFLIDDGEESGLLGAEAFEADPDLARSVAFVINMEARGTTGPAFLFETSRNNRWMLPDIARALPRPIGSSFFVTIYDLLPNDTDLTVFKRDGKAGLNLAYIGNVAHYHTRLDNLAHANATVIQQRGDQALALLRHFASSDLRRTSPTDAVWFDVVTFFIIWWPAAATIWLALTGLLLTIVAAALHIREGTTNARAITTGVLAFFAALLAAGIAGFVLSWLIGLRASAMWVASPAPSIAAMWLTGMAAAFFAAALFVRRGGPEGLALGHALVWNVIAIGLALALPGASYFAIVPGLALAIAALLRAFTGGGELASSIAGAVAAFVVMGPVALVAYDALGRPSLTLLALFLAVMTTAASPFLATGGRTLAGITGAGALVLTVVALLLPPYTQESPRRLSLLHQTQNGRAVWLAETLTPALCAAAPFDATPRDQYPWYGGWALYSAPAPAIPITPVEATIVSDVRAPKRTLTLDLVSRRNAPRVGLAWKTTATVDAIRINGIAPPPRSARFHDAMAPGWHQVLVRGSSARIEIVMRELAPIAAVAMDATFGLPPEGTALLRARDGLPAVASQEGDQTSTRRTYTW